MARSTHNVIGKVSIGTPLKEPMLVGDDMVGLKAAEPINELRIRKGRKIKERDVERMKKKGVEELFVVRGRSPDVSKHFRLMRRSDQYQGEFVEDPSLNEKYGLPKHPTKIPIIFPINDKTRVFKDGMRNWDAKSKKMFCQSHNLRDAKRAVVKGGEYTGQHKEIDCVPFYRDQRDLPICPFRDHDSEKQSVLPCKYRMRLFFNILTNDIETFNMGSFFKFESSSHNTGQQIEGTIDDMLSNKQFGKLSFIPCELELKFDKRVTPGGHKTEQPTVNLSLGFKLLSEYRELVNEAKEIVSTYGLEVNIQDDTSQEAIDSEFRPEVERRQMIEDGLFDEEKQNHLEDASLLEENTGFYEKKKHIEALARRLDQEDYESYVARKDKLSPDNIDKYIERTERYLDKNLSQEEQEENFEQNSSS